MIVRVITSSSEIDYKKSMLKKMPSYSSNHTEHKIMTDEGFDWIYDCGNMKFVKVN